MFPYGEYSHKEGAWFTGREIGIKTEGSALHSLNVPSKLMRSR